MIKEQNLNNSISTWKVLLNKTFSTIGEKWIKSLLADSVDIVFQDTDNKVNSILKHMPHNTFHSQCQGRIITSQLWSCLWTDAAGENKNCEVPSYWEQLYSPLYAREGVSVAILMPAQSMVVGLGNFCICSGFLHKNPTLCHISSECGNQGKWNLIMIHKFLFLKIYFYVF